MLRRREIHRDMADVNVYTAKKLNDMATSLSGLARACSEEVNNESKLEREDGLAAMQAAAAMVCGECSRCSLYADSAKEDSYYMYYLLRAFEQKGTLSYGDMPRHFLETCQHKDEYVGYLNRNLGKATMNLSWKNRFLESRDAIIIQFREMASILEEFSNQMEHAIDITQSGADTLKKLFRRNHMDIENLLVLQYGNERKEAFLTLKTNNGRCVTAREAAELVGTAMGSKDWCVAKDSKSIITRQTSTIRFVEEGKYRMIHGIAKIPKQGETVSGDNYTFEQIRPSQAIMSLSDGMGSGNRASQESKRVIELTEQLLETGFSSRTALKLVNTVLILTGGEQHPATLDLCCIDLHTGVLEAMKLGAVATYIIGEDGVELLEARDVPMGVINPIEPVLLSKKLWDDNRIIMVSDGVLDVLPGDEKELVLQEYLQSMPIKTPQDMAERILKFACSFTSVARDDMTVLTAGIWKRNK